MSDIQELIHKTSMDCIEKGQRMEQERIIKLLEDLYLKRDADGNVLDTKHNEDLLYVIALIKGEN